MATVPTVQEHLAALREARAELDELIIRHYGDVVTRDARFARIGEALAHVASAIELLAAEQARTTELLAVLELDADDDNDGGAS